MKKNGDVGDGLNSNTKARPNQLTKWFFTWNNYDSSKIKELETRFLEICWRGLFQSEVGESGTPHLQGAIWLKNAMRYSEFKLPSEIHWEKLKDDKHALEYCRKDGKDGYDGKHRWQFNIPKKIKIIENLNSWQLEAEVICLMEPDGRTINWWYDSKGGIGKSSFCKYMVVKYNAVVIQGGKLADIMNIIFNTNMDNVTTVIIDIPRCNKNAVSYASIECILNGMITNTKYETGRKIFNPPNMLVFSNFEPDKSQLSEDRWNIRNLSPDFEIEAEDY